MPSRPPKLRPASQPNRQKQRQQADQRRNNAQPWRAWYASTRWHQVRRAQLQAHPLCVMCEREGRVTAAKVCDHVDPHRGDPEKFWAGPFQSLCEPHHNSTKQLEERRGYSDAIGPDGWPVDPKHPANR